MGLLMTATNVEKVRDGMWEFEMPPHQVRHFGNTNHSIGSQSILLADNAVFNEEKHELRFAPDQITPINIGTSPRVLALATNLVTPKSKSAVREDQIDLVNLGPGDQEFLALATKELSDDMAQTATMLLRRVRMKSAGDLKRGQSRNFSETPDNFWYIIVQPRINELSITIRGPVAHFKAFAKLEVKDDRGNTRFKVRKMSDIEHALEIIFRAEKKS